VVFPKISLPASGASGPFDCTPEESEIRLVVPATTSMSRLAGLFPRMVILHLHAFL
jgi:hypothetical protein